MSQEEVFARLLASVPDGASSVRLARRSDWPGLLGRRFADVRCGAARRLLVKRPSKDGQGSMTASYFVIFVSVVTIRRTPKGSQ
jgi:hypothetical protein